MKLEYQVDPPSWLGRLVVGLIALSFVASWASDLLLSNFIDQHPLGLIALGPSDRNLALTVNDVDLVWYFVVGLVRHLSTDPLFYLVGFWYGDNAVQWVAKRSKSFGESADEIIPQFRSWSWVAVFLMPFNIVCLLAGAAGLKFRTFIIVNIAGTVTRLFLISQFASYFESEVSGISDFISRNRWPVFGVSLALVAWTVYNEFGSDKSQLKDLSDLTNDEADATADAETTTD